MPQKHKAVRAAPALVFVGKMRADITERERAILTHLAEQLQLSTHEVEQLEDELGAIVPALNRHLRSHVNA